MRVTAALIRRNVKLFFKDKAMFITALITPVILLMLYMIFLGDVYRDSFLLGLPQGVVITEKAVDGLVACQLLSSILAVSCVTVAFCSNFLMVQDKATGVTRDLRISPVTPATLSVSYYVATLISTLIICLVAMLLGLLYVACVGWYLSLADVLFLTLDVLLLVLFGTALSSVISFFLTTQGQISAVGTIVSSGYGFICGAYMPISNFADGLQRVISFFPGTYAMSLLRTHALRGVLGEMETQSIPVQATDATRDMLDLNLYFFDRLVPSGAKYAVLCGAILLLVGVYILLNTLKKAEK